MFFALTPTFGAQMPLVTAWWIAVLKWRRDWSSSLPVALALTWSTNVITVPPLYYLYTMTGRVVLGHWDRLRTYTEFLERFSTNVSNEGGVFDTVLAQMSVVIARYALPIIVGSTPWIALGTAISFMVALKVFSKYPAPRI